MRRRVSARRRNCLADRRNRVDPAAHLPDHLGWSYRELLSLPTTQRARARRLLSMDPANSGDVTLLLREAARGNSDAFSELMTLVYRELNELAHRKLRLEAPGHTLSTTGLVHEAYLKLVDQTRADWRNREQFFAVAAESMRRVLTDHARKRLRAKRGGRHEHVELQNGGDVVVSAFFDEHQTEEIIALDESLQRLAAFNPEGARIVELRFYCGMTNTEVAEVIDSSERTVRRSWSVAKAWLRRELDGLGVRVAALTAEGDGKQ
jgi:RNA polymerase sigma factor (TIGR02999 family)